MDETLTRKKEEAGVSELFMHLQRTPRCRTNKAMAKFHLDAGVLS